MTYFPSQFRIVPASAEWLALRHALTETTVPCQEKPEWWTSDDAEKRQEAVELCAGCPLMELCRSFAVVNKEPHGVWGGQDLTKTR